MKELIGKKVESILGGRQYLKLAGCIYAYTDNGLMIKVFKGNSKVNTARITQVGNKFDCEFFICTNGKCALRSRFLSTEEQLMDIFHLGTHTYPVFNQN